MKSPAPLAALFTLTAFPAASKIPCPEYFECAASTLGTYVVQHDEYGSFGYGPADGPVVRYKHYPLWVTIPDEARADPDFYKYRLIQIETRVVWVSDELLLLNQRNHATGEAMCPILNARTGYWEEGAWACVWPSGYNLNALDPGPNGLIAAYSSSEGAPVAQLFRWTPEAGMTELPFPEYDLYGGGLNIEFTDDDRSVRVITQCDLAAKDRRPCHPVHDENRPVRIYHWDTNGETPPRQIDE